MELRHLKYFLAVAETQNIRLAAKKVHVTQPAISKKIKELETELGVQLFDRLPKGLSLNKAGEIYQKRLGPIMVQIAEANAKVRQFANTEYGSLGLGAPDFLLWGGEVTQVMNQFRSSNDKVELEMFSDSPAVLLKRLELDQIDGTFVYSFSPLPSEYEAKEVARDRLVLAYPVSWSSKVSSSMSIDDLNQLPAVRFARSADPQYFEWQEMVLHQLGWLPSNVQWAHGEGTMLGLVAAQAGIAIVNERHASRPSPLVEFMPLDNLTKTITLHFVYKKSADNPALNTFLTLLLAHHSN